jgi:hypothetical protein
MRSRWLEWLAGSAGLEINDGKGWAVCGEWVWFWFGECESPQLSGIRRRENKSPA